MKRLSTSEAAALPLAVIALLLFAGFSSAQVVDNTTLTEKIICGYQGWFACPGDGNAAGIGWNHWSKSSSDIGPGLYNTDMWPDVVEYDSSDLFYCPNVTLGSGNPAYLFSDFRQGAVNVHFRWMQENHIDGVLFQRFVNGCVGDPNDPWQRKMDVSLQNALNAAISYGRVIALEYDISGAPEDSLYSMLTNDWNYMETAFDITDNPRYLYHNNKPVVAIWGLGFNDRPGTPQIASDIISWFKNQGCFVIGGVPWGWRTLTGGSKTDPAWNAVYRSYNGISPWSVGAYSDWNGISSFVTNYAQPDLNECNSLGILYMPVMWPRFGWDNMFDYPCGTSKISPRGGQHFWDQAYAYQNIGVSTQKIAMFDEYDESTAIMKMADDVPTGACFWTNEGKPADWHLRLANQASKMLRDEIPLSQTIPISPTTSPDNATIVSDTIPTAMNPGQQYNVTVTVQNTGETCWNAEMFKLGAVNDSDPFCAFNRVVMSPGETVMPGQQKVFGFTMTAPSNDGDYNTDWQMVHECVRWFGSKVSKVVRVGAGPDTLNNSTFDADADGWTIATWRAGTSGYGTMSWSGAAGRTGGGMRSTGYGTKEDIKRCNREGGEISKTVSTVGHTGVTIYYDLRVNSLGQEKTGAGIGTCMVDHDLIDEQITVFYSTNGGTDWTEAEWLKRDALKAGYQTYDTRAIDLSDTPGVNNNADFTVRFRWQFNLESDIGDLDNIRIVGNATDVTPPGQVTNFTAIPGDCQNSLSWTNPTDADYAGTMVRFKTTGYPTSPTDGTQIYNGTGTSVLHTGLTNGVTYFYSAFTYDEVPNYSSAANANGTPNGYSCFVDNFPYVDGNLNGNGGWTGSATTEIQVVSETVEMFGGASMKDAIRTVSCGDPGSGYILVHMKVHCGVGDATMWSLYIDDAAGANLARWYGTGTTARGRIGGTSIVTPVQTLTGNWDNLKVKITPSADTSEFFFNDVSIGMLDHSVTGAGDAIGRLRFERTDNSGADGHYLYFDNLRIGP